MDHLIFKPSPFGPVGFKRLTKLGINKKPKLVCKVRVGRPSKLDKSIGLILEEYFANDMSIVDICEKYNVSHTFVSHKITRMFPVRMTENTIVITLQSKINEN